MRVRRGARRRPPTIRRCTRRTRSSTCCSCRDAIERGALDEAEKLLDEGLAPLPGQQLAALLAGAAVRGSGRNSKALDVLESLADDSPDDAAMLNALGYLLTDQFDRHEEARGYIERRSR